VREIGEAAVQGEVAMDRERYDVQAEAGVHARSVRVGLGLRSILERGPYTAFSMSFLAFDSGEGPANVVPFLEASNAMSRGIGYAGEGDVLTAGLVGALGTAFGRTTFTEMFCPDWKGNAIFLSHMGEINPAVLKPRPVVVERPYAFSAALPPAIVTGSLQAGPGVLVNLAPSLESGFCILASQVKVLGDAANPTLHASVRGWIRPPCDLPEFLEQYSLNGGTHHCALVLGDCLEGIAAFAEFAGLDLTVI
ncbi:MAG: hypothetical protein JXR77_12345, partial [Lentisphaeria bacterium]|nr:hypothetical protein [Lentisphaeria bacterium]